MQPCASLPESPPIRAAFDVRLYGDEAARASVEGYIARRYARCHGARIEAFQPYLLTAERVGGCAAAVGLRLAGREPLFLEQYLDASIEATVAASLRAPVERTQVVEIGNLAVSSRRAGELLIALLIEGLRGAGFRWLAFTATRQVRALVQGLGFPLHVLAPADAARLGTARDAWGRYYEAQPQVMAGDLGVGVAQLRADPRLAALVQGQGTALARLAQALR